MNAGMNVWENSATGEIVKSDTFPEGDFWFAKYPKSRVHGEMYTPYQGHSEWEQAANRGMAAEANYNFRFNRK